MSTQELRNFYFHKLSHVLNYSDFLLYTTQIQIIDSLNRKEELISSDPKKCSLMKSLIPWIHQNLDPNIQFEYQYSFNFFNFLGYDYYRKCKYVRLD